MIRKLFFVFIFFISIRVYAVAETAVFKGLLMSTQIITETEDPRTLSSDTTRQDVIFVDSLNCKKVEKDSIDDIPFFYFEQKVSSYKNWFNSFRVF